MAARALELTSADALSNYGDGAWPHLTAYNRGELASNGNFLENDEISVRHGICGALCVMCFVWCRVCFHNVRICFHRVGGGISIGSSSLLCCFEQPRVLTDSP